MLATRMAHRVNGVVDKLLWKHDSKRAGGSVINEGP